MKSFVIYLLLFVGLVPTYLAQNSTYIDSIIRQLQFCKEDTNKLNLLSILSENAEDDVWPMYNNELGKLAAKLQFSTNPLVKKSGKKYLASSLNNKGYYFYNKSIAYKAIIYFNLSLKLYKELGDLKGSSYALNNLGAIYDSKGDIAKALELYLESLKIREQIGFKRGIAESLNNIAIIYNGQNDFKNALKYHQKSVEIRKQLNNQASISLAYNNVGSVYFRFIEYHKEFNHQTIDSLLQLAYNQFQLGFNASVSIDDFEGQGLSYYNMAQYYNTKADNCLDKTGYVYDTLLTHAETYFNKSAETYSHLERDEMVLNSNIGLADVYYKKNDIEAAKKIASSALIDAKKMGYPDMIQRAALILKKYYHQKELYKQEVEMNNLYYTMRDSVSNEQTKKETLTKYFTYENEKKEAVLKLSQEKIELEYQAKAKQQRIIIYFVLASLLLISVFSVFLFNRFKISRKQNVIISKQKQEVEIKSQIIEEKQKEILDSIHYAKRIQNALLVQQEFLNAHLPNNFIVFKPKDIVSGDFYWATTYNNRFYIAICDSTGHGVPGAFMSILNIGFLSEAIKEKHITEPHKIFDYVRERLITSISKDEQKDGFDGILLCLDYSEVDANQNEQEIKITYAAAHNSPILISGNQLLELPKDKMPVGQGERKDAFNLYSISAKKGDALFLYTDGFPDQFGGPKGKKFKYKPLNELLLKNHQLAIAQQSSILQETFDNWKGELEQVDDVLLIGINL